MLFKDQHQTATGPIITTIGVELVRHLQHPERNRLQRYQRKPDPCNNAIRWGHAKCEDTVGQFLDDDREVKVMNVPRDKMPVFGNIIVDDRLRLAYIGIPKAGNTSVKKWLAESFGVALPNEGRINIHDRVKYPFEYRTNRWLAKHGKSYLVFTVVRSPLERLASAYRDKIQREKVHTPLQKLGFTNAMSFGDFIQLACDIPDDEADVHIRSQWAMLSYEGQFLPNLTVHLGEINKIRLLAQYEPLLDKPVTKENATSNRAVKITNKFQSLIRKRYIQDYEFFGFE